MNVATATGGSPSGGHPRDAFYASCAAVGVKKVKSHGLRHTAGSLWLENGVSLLRVSRWLDHSTMRTMQATYVHLLREPSHDDSLSLEKMLSIRALSR